jgi:hypothetical protein
MNESLNDIISLGNWVRQYLLPALNRINSLIKDFNISNVAYSRVEADLKENNYSWAVSTVFNKIWKKSDEDWVDEVVLSVEIKKQGVKIILDVDVSLGNGEILFEMHPNSILYKMDLSVSDFETYFCPQLDMFFKESVDYIYKALISANDFTQQNP